MTQYSMTPITSGTRMRSDHNTFSSVIASYNRGQLVVGDELWEAPADGVNAAQRGWMAYIHKGAPICENFTVIEDPTPPPAPVFPESFTLVDPSGAKAEYVFVRIIEE